jgi:choline dehydrogenase-like flavoprotein
LSNTANRKIPVQRQVLGGSSAINGLVWVRDSRSTTPGRKWARAAGRQDVAPLFARIESYENGEPRRGTAGLRVSVPDQNPITTPVQGGGRSGFKWIRTTTARTRKAW